ncbi:diguanylate cyclase domain-containing protein [Paenibacillus sp. N3.4]|uniref:GGDEF domain-containing protein n=1 Tax=Paenibacillus sp. N3.4 TaxID=2603222 RepID=UPI0011CB011F|nr:diguanylate cyclase [Paenibacillus sp. N3.4]TXK72366.1 diguanylate cyclase [Paenibacillus sp. N3.4]
MGEAKKLDIWVIVLAILIYGVVNLFVLLPKEFYFENMIMLSVLFTIAILSYFTGMVISLGMGALVIFFYGSYVMYGTVVLGKAVESHVYYWMVLVPGSAVVSATIGSKIRLIQEENIRMKSDYAKYVTVDESTGLNNVKAFYGMLTQYMGLSRRYKLPLNLMMVNIMYFEDIKSIVGQDRMEDILKLIGQQLVDLTRVEDRSYMLEDGRTFATLLFGNAVGAEVVKQRIKETIQQYSLDHAVAVNMELRVGIAEYNDSIKDVISMRKAAEKDMEYDV